MTESVWPTQIWAPWQDNADPMTGMADFRAPPDLKTQYGITKGLHDDWVADYKGTVGKSNAWDVLGSAEVDGNALFAVAAEALGYDWEDFRTNALNEIGVPEDYEAAQDFYDDYNATGPTSPGMPNTPIWQTVGNTAQQDAWDDLTDEQQDIVRDMPPISSGGPDPLAGTPWAGTTLPGIGSGVIGTIAGAQDDEDPPYDWGIGLGHSQISEDLSEMQDWLENVYGTAKDQAADIIAEGPKGSAYGIEGSIFEYLGLTEAPDAPKELAVEFASNQMQTRTSRATYSKPSDRYQDIDLAEEFNI